MRKLDKAKQIAAPSLVEVRRAARDEAERLGDELGLSMPGERREQRPTTAYLVNWLLCWYLTRPAADREKIVREGKAVFDRHLASDTPIGFGVAEEVRPPRARRRAGEDCATKAMGS